MAAARRIATVDSNRQPRERILGLTEWWVLLVLLVAPWLATNFVLSEILGASLTIGTIALSLMLLAGYGGMVSLMQMTVAGFAGYMLAVFGVSGIGSISLGWPWWLAASIALALATVLVTLIGALALRTAGIYTIMITLAIGAAFFYFANQNWSVFNGHTGFSGIAAPHFWGIDWREDVPFYYLTLGVAAACYAGVVYVSRAPFGLALQGVRENPRRMAALGFHVDAHRIAAYAMASFIAALGGLLQTWNYRQISPGTVSVERAIDVLIVAVIGGVSRPAGAYLGALVFVMLRTFALDVLVDLGLDGNRFRLLIGLGFLAVVLWSSDGILGLWDRWQQRRKDVAARSAATHEHA